MKTKPFGYTIVDKDGNHRNILYDDFEIVSKGLRLFDGSRDSPHRAVELYTKEQLEKAIKNERQLCQKICDDAVESYLAVSLPKVAGCIEDISARIGDRSVGEAAHGIVSND